MSSSSPIASGVIFLPSAPVVADSASYAEPVASLSDGVPGTIPASAAPLRPTEAVPVRVAPLTEATPTPAGKADATSTVVSAYDLLVAVTEHPPSTQDPVSATEPCCGTNAT